MSCTNDAHILEALHTLRDVAPEALRRHRADALLTFQNLQKFVDDNGPTDSRTLFAGDPHSNSSPHLQQGVSSSSETENLSLPRSGALCSLASTPIVNFQRPGTPSTQQVLNLSSMSDSMKSANSPALVGLMQALDKAEDLIKEYLSRSEVEATKDVLLRIVEDPRVVDLKLGKKPSPEATFRKGLGHRSLALEYEQWELCVHNTSKVTELVKDPSLSQERRHGHIREYLQNNTHRFKDQAATGKGIEHGIKLLVFERMFGGKAISAILSFTYRRFRAVRYEELAPLQDLMSHSQWLVNLASSKAAWLDRCQRHYEDWCNKSLQNNVRSENTSQARHKRRRLDHVVALSPLDERSKVQASRNADVLSVETQVPKTAQGPADSRQGSDDPQQQSTSSSRLPSPQNLAENFSDSYLDRTVNGSDANHLRSGEPGSRQQLQIRQSTFDPSNHAREGDAPHTHRTQTECALFDPSDYAQEEGTPIAHHTQLDSALTDSSNYTQEERHPFLPQIQTDGAFFDPSSYAQGETSLASQIQTGNALFDPSSYAQGETSLASQIQTGNALFEPSGYREGGRSPPANQTQTGFTDSSTYAQGVRSSLIPQVQMGSTAFSPLRYTLDRNPAFADQTGIRLVPFDPSSYTQQRDSSFADQTGFASFDPSEYAEQRDTCFAHRQQTINIA